MIRCEEDAGGRNWGKAVFPKNGSGLAQQASQWRKTVTLSRHAFDYAPRRIGWDNIGQPQAGGLIQPSKLTRRAFFTSIRHHQHLDVNQFAQVGFIAPTEHHLHQQHLSIRLQGLPAVPQDRDRARVVPVMNYIRMMQASAPLGISSNMSMDTQSQRLERPAAAM